MVSDNSSVLHKSAITMLLVSCVNPFSCWLQALLSVGNYYHCYTVAPLPGRLCLDFGACALQSLPGGRAEAALPFGSPCAFPALLFSLAASQQELVYQNPWHQDPHHCPPFRAPNPRQTLAHCPSSFPSIAVLKHFGQKQVGGGKCLFS